MNKNNTGIQPSHVVDSEPTRNANGKVTGYRCWLSDGSIWSCDSKGEKWVKESLAVHELSVKFLEQRTKDALEE